MSEPSIDVRRATRAELQAYLEARGFAVYEHEDTEDLRQAALLDIEERPTGEHPILTRSDE